MSTYDKLDTINDSLNDIKTAIIGKGVTPTGNITTYATAIANIPTGGGEFQLTRFKDDTNTEIGTYFCNFTDGSGNTYKVILLDAQYRNDSTQWCSNSSTAVTNMPLYSNLKSSNVWEAGETATQNTQLILDFCTAGGYTSTACSHCRSKSFTVGGVTYYGQLPNLLEVSYIARNYNSFDAMDTSASSQSSLNFSSALAIWSSSQYNSGNGWFLSSNNGVTTGYKTINYYFACPVLEIPL